MPSPSLRRDRAESSSGSSLGTSSRKLSDGSLSGWTGRLVSQVPGSLRRPPVASSLAEGDVVASRKLGGTTLEGGSSSRRSLPQLQTPGAELPGGKKAFSLRHNALRRAADNIVNIFVLGGVIASFITPVGHIALAVGLGLSLATSLPDWASKQHGTDRKMAALIMGVGIALAFGSVMAILAVGTGPVGWTLSGLASAAMLARFGLLMHANRGQGMRHALRASICEMLNIKPVAAKNA